jgi:negative regulator of flagellin synthesis FlgM
MSIDISQISSNRPEGPKRQDSSKVSTSAAQSDVNKPTASPTQDTSDSVSLSSAAKNLAKIESELRSLPDIDQSKVDAIKARVDSGEYQVDSQNLAQKMLSIEV